ncbi:phospholipase D family protein [Saccharibacillus sp. CPCC 101409]|uniref:phospholipase D family protein n=1 Tax=Saccharibacillus sp. CPCC 101409 TaxID=3058041 RepID=UPI00267247B4|nr:phospholipase D family protein [Saccharibacillus sp. CPCC 101409]MDO3408820.1 phospholipase D family protein [Saccharibacillus sp. CPCC 101409]
MMNENDWSTHRSGAIMRAGERRIRGGTGGRRRFGRKGGSGGPGTSPFKKPRLGAARWALILLVFWLLAVLLYQMNKPLPEGVSYESPVYRTDNVDFLYDLTIPKPNEQFTQERQIFDRAIEMIGEAKQFIVIDVFLFNDYIHKDQKYPKVSAKLANTLIERKKEIPDLDIVFITDEVNTNYGSAPNELLERMKKAGIDVVVTDVDPLRDSTPVYSAVWRTFIQWFGQSGSGWIPNVMATDGPDVTLRSYLKLLNVKANHRKAFITENGAMISSGNVHDASAYHSNVALEVSGPIIGDMLKAEQAVLNFSGGGTLPDYEAAEDGSEGQYAVQYLTEGKVYNHVLEELGNTQQGDAIWMGMFYLADKKVLKALEEAADRGVTVNLVLDPNENAFGREKIGIPNRPIAAELHKENPDNIEIRWYNTTKEQYHTKMMLIERTEGESSVMAGSTNFTPRNLKDYNLENELFVTGPGDSELIRNVDAYFERIWNNEDAEYTQDLETHQEKTTWLKDLAYQLQMVLGFTTF